MAFSVGGVPVSGCIPGHIIRAYTQTTFLIQHPLIFFVFFAVVLLCCVFFLVGVEDILYQTNSTTIHSRKKVNVKIITLAGN